MRSHSGMDSRLAPVLACAAALITVLLAGAPAARAEDAAKKEPASGSARPPVSAAAIEAATQPTPSSKAGASTATTAGASSAPSAKTAGAESDSAMILRGGQERTDFRSMTIEGEDRVHVEVERPELALELDAEKVPGLESGSAGDVLNRVAPDLTTAYLGLSAQHPSPYLARPWLRQFATGPVARFRPNVKGVERWKLVVLDSKGEVVRTYQGKGDVPKEITWDGRSQQGALVTPGLTYSYYFEAFDKAGNKRNFVGEGFRVSAYRADGPSGPVLVFSGQSLLASQKTTRPSGVGFGSGTRATPAVILETASWLNQSSKPGLPIRVSATARSYEQANLLAKQVGTALAELSLGDPARIQTVAEVAPDAADGGVVRVGYALGPEPPAPARATPPAGKGKESGAKSKARK